MIGEIISDLKFYEIHHEDILFEENFIFLNNQEERHYSNTDNFFKSTSGKSTTKNFYIRFNRLLKDILYIGKREKVKCSN